MYLFESTQEFFDSTMFEGQKFYNATPYRPWFGWIYIALYDHLGIEEYKKDPNPDVQIKIGRSTDIKRRNRELHKDAVVDGRTQKKASIVYAWSVPLEIKFESDLKTLLAAYIRQDPKIALSSEIIWGIPIVPLINIIQLSIFRTCLELNVIHTETKFKMQPFDSILDASLEYTGRQKYIIPHQIVMDDIFESLDIQKGETESIFEYIFVPGRKSPVIPETKTLETPVFENTYEDVPTYIETTEFMKGPTVYPIGTIMYAKYTPEKTKDNPKPTSTNHLALIVGYAGGQKVKQQYAIRWLREEDSKPVRTDDEFELSSDPWQYTTSVFKPTKDFAKQYGITIVNKVAKFRPLRF